MVLMGDAACRAGLVLSLTTDTKDPRLPESVRQTWVFLSAFYRFVSGRV